MIPFSPPRIDKKTIAEVTEALQSGWITTGPKTKLFEKKIAEYCIAMFPMCWRLIRGQREQSCCCIGLA